MVANVTNRFYQATEPSELVFGLLLMSETNAPLFAYGSALV